MNHFRFVAERVLDAPAEVIYGCLADYRQHHRVGGFLPPAFTDLQVLRGGVGAGTIIRFTTTVGGRSVTRTQEVSEPEPGHILVESGNGEGSTFTVEPRAKRALVRIETVINTNGLEGMVLRVFGARILGSIMRDELSRLERHAQAQIQAPDEAIARTT